MEMSPSPNSKLRSGSGANLWEKLVMDVEQGTRLVAHTEEVYNLTRTFRNPHISSGI